jgi:hypothetical protein
MPSIPPSSPTVIGGIDTHKDLHVVAVLDTSEVVLGTEAFSTTPAGYRALVRWLRTFGDVRLVGIEGTGSYGAGVTRHLLEAGIEVVESTGPTAATAGGAARTTPSTPRTPLVLPWPAGAPAPPRPRTARSRRCACSA